MKADFSPQPSPGCENSRRSFPAFYYPSILEDLRYKSKSIAERNHFWIVWKKSSQVGKEFITVSFSWLEAKGNSLGSTGQSSLVSALGPSNLVLFVLYPLSPTQCISFWFCSLRIPSAPGILLLWMPRLTVTDVLHHLPAFTMPGQHCWGKQSRAMRQLGGSSLLWERINLDPWFISN